MNTVCNFTEDLNSVYCEKDKFFYSWSFAFCIDIFQLASKRGTFSRICMMFTGVSIYSCEHGWSYYVCVALMSSLLSWILSCCLLSLALTVPMMPTFCIILRYVSITNWPWWRELGFVYIAPSRRQPRSLFSRGMLLSIIDIVLLVYWCRIFWREKTVLTSAYFVDNTVSLSRYFNP